VSDRYEKEWFRRELAIWEERISEKIAALAHDVGLLAKRLERLEANHGVLEAFEPREWT
jgi:hypothetical protein